ncbi:hypothetical protein B2I21_18080 [Chryseobacterium mucoviscidosis]|nr:hypothetical protein B2I21_18080 [Chryseobacterium mucoviscidosis]
MQQDQGNRLFQDGYAGIRSNRACYGLYKHMKQMKERGRIIYNPDPIYFIKVPERWGQLRSRVPVE